MSAYYNELDPKAAATLRELILEGLIAPGDVDERSIEDVLPSEIAGYTQVHLFAGFGIWSLAFRMAGWPDSRPVWSASFPCQPFSAAGKGDGFDDERHLWPSGFWLLQHGKRAEVPIYGEQVASPDGLVWLDLVRADLETIDHACWSTVLASAGFGAPIIRQRTYWLACGAGQGWQARRAGEACDGGYAPRLESGRLLDAGGLAFTDGGITSNRELQRSGKHGFIAPHNGVVRMGSPIRKGLEGFTGDGDGASRRKESPGPIAATGGPCGMGSSEHAGRQPITHEPRGDGERIGAAGEGFKSSVPILHSDDSQWPGPTNGFWSDADWLRCRDDKWRPVEPGTFPLAHGYPERMGILRGAGNAISPQVAAAWISSTEALL